MADSLTIKQFAIKLRGVISDRTLFDWAAKGVISKPAKGSRGRGDCWLWIEQIIKHYQAQVSEDEDLLRAARIRGENARANKVELHVAEMSGELVRATEVVQLWSAALSVTKAKFLALSSTLTDELAGITDAAIRKEIIDAAIHEALEELGGGELVCKTAGIIGEGTDSPEATAEAYGE